MMIFLYFGIIVFQSELRITLMLGVLELCIRMYRCHALLHLTCMTLICIWLWVRASKLVNTCVCVHRLVIKSL